MKRQFRFALLVTCSSASLAAQAIVITQNIDNDTITPGNSVACIHSGGHDDNLYARGFNLADYGITDPFQVSSVRFGVQQAVARSGSQEITVLLYDGYTPFGSELYPGRLVAMSTFMLSNGSGFFHVEGISALITSGRVVAAVYTPYGVDDGNFFFIGSNANGQTAPSYLQAPECQVYNLTDTAAIGYPGMHELICIDGQPVPEPATLAALGLGALAVIRRRRQK